MSHVVRENDYFTRQYGLTATHSEVVEASKIVQPCKTLDLGCGRGRNSLFLANLGFDLTSVDANPNAIEFLRQVITQEGITNIDASLYDINQAALKDTYDFIVSTVVLMFLDQARIPDVIANMQASTHSGGHNLIVCAMDTDDYPCNRFSFKFKEGELRDYYQDWKMVKYNENVGSLHHTDANGNFLQFQFATMLARKP